MSEPNDKKNTSKPASVNVAQTQKESFFEFPCQFPIKVMANPQKETVQFVLDTLEKYVENPDKIEFKTRESKTGKYLSITAIFTATSKAQLDHIYRDLSGHKDIHMVL